MSRTLKRAIVCALGFTIWHHTVGLLALPGEPQRPATGKISFWRQILSTRIARSQILCPSNRICLSSRELLAQSPNLIGWRVVSKIACQRGGSRRISG